jgi:aldose 1-epimerase
MRGMTAPVELRTAALHLSLRPELGGCVEGLWFNGTPVLRSSSPGTLKNVQRSACYPLVPFLTVSRKRSCSGTAPPTRW